MNKLIILFFTLYLSLNVLAQEKYAVLIVGSDANKLDYLSDIPSSSLWNNGDDYSERGMMEFWNDTYLIWELLIQKGFTNENIFVLYADGEDNESSSKRYTPPAGIKITDYAANSSSVIDLFNNLLNGTNGIPRVTSNDFLFVWTFGHGARDQDDNYSILLKDGLFEDTLFSPLVNNIPANKKAVWMQQCHSGGFANTLQNSNMVFHSACQPNQLAYRADDQTVNNIVYVENELINDTIYTHGEFNYHVISVNKGLSPTNQNNYNGQLYSTADINNDNVISFYETYVWENEKESIDKERGEEPLYNDIGNIGINTSLEYPTILFDTISSYENVRGLIGVTKDLIVKSGATLVLSGDSDIKIEDSVKIIVNYGGTIIIDGNITINGNNNTIVLDGDYVKNNNASLTLNNINIETNTSIVIDNISFNNSTVSATSLLSSNLNVNNNIVVSNCIFNNPDKSFCININGYSSYNIVNNYINSCGGNGIKIYYSGERIINPMHNITNNNIVNCASTGLLLYSSTASINMNNITRNNIGVKLLNNSSILQLSGDQNSNLSNTQRITRNYSYEIYMTSSCIPIDFHYNYIYDIDSVPFIYYDPSVGYYPSNPPISRLIIDVTNNNWNNITDPTNYLASMLTNTTYLWDPIWYGENLQKCSDIDSLMLLVDKFIDKKDYFNLENVCKSIINNYPETIYSELMLKLLFEIEELVDNDYNSLKSYYLNDSLIRTIHSLSHLSNYLANKCDEKIGNWHEAINYYHNMMNNSNNYNDSLFASIDLNHLYLKLGIKNNYNWDEYTDVLLSSLPKVKHENLPEYYWTDLVTSQPEGYVVDGNGDVLITTAEGMAWLISTVNGLNGQDANDYEDVVIRLENDIDISGNVWTSIGTENNPFKGIFDGQGFDINGIYMNNAEEGRNYGLFGYINNAVIKDLILGKGTIVGYEECGGIACFADNMSLIDRCIVKTTMEYSHNSGGVVGINRDSKISNSALMSEMFSTAETYVGGIVGQNISANADAIIENCFATSMFGSSYSTFFAAGIAARNISEGNDYKAIIRNCYSAPISMYGELCGGIVGYNSENSLIENSYCKNSSDYALCGENHGEIVNCSVFSSSDMEFINMVEVFGTETYYLLDALNIWVDNYSEGEYLSWVVGDVNINYGYPYFVENIDNIAEISNDIISIYPNPTENNITIEAEDIIQIEVYNTLGQMVERIGAEGNSVELDMSDYSDGIYLIKTVSKEGSTVSRVVKM